MAGVTSETPEPARARRKGIYLLPNLLTTGCLFSGFYAVVAAIDQHFDKAGMAVFAAMIFDTLDGRIARLTRTESSFGKEYDSLADMVAFGLAPAIVAYQWGVVRIMEYGRSWGRFGWLACFFYAAAAALRLARAAPGRPDRRIRRDRERRRLDGEQLRLPELQAVQPRPPYQVRLHAPGAAVLRTDRDRSAHHAPVHIRNICPFRAGAVGSA